jgi:ABC-type dipeptide/oligopeptide/nickel transport system permease component
MIRVLLREALLTALLLLVVSVTAFVLLDSTGQHDWWGTVAPAARFGVPREAALATDLPRLWNRRVADALVRTQADLAELGDPATRPAARARLLHRGTAALPVILAQLRRLPPASQQAALELLAELAPSLTGGEIPPAERDAALKYWDRFVQLRGLDFRRAYARRLVQRLVDRESRNAAEQLTRLGTFALPAVFDLLEQPMDSDSAQRLTALLAEITGRPMRVPPGASLAETRAIVDGWRAWWFAERLEFESLGGTQRLAGHVLETRYGRWLSAAMAGRFGIAAVTGRPIALELRERLPASLFVGGLGGLLATALVVAFGGGPALRRRPLRTKLLDLTGALIPGLAAFLLAFALFVQLCAAPRPAAPLAREIFAHWPRLAIAVVLLGAIAVLWLRRRAARVLLHAVRHEAEAWAIENRHPKLGEVVRHGARVGLASLLAPLGLSATAVVTIGTVVETLAGVRGMGALTLSSLRQWDAPWLLMATLSAAPLWMGGRWARRILIWALGDTSVPRTASESGPADASAATEPATTAAAEER